MTPIRLVCATRARQATFARSTLLGMSLGRMKRAPSLELAVTFENRAGLPIVYNQQIVMPQRDKILVFVHDDVWIDDFFFAQRIEEALREFDIIGIAGNSRGGAEQCAWHFRAKVGDWDAGHLSGAVAHKGRGISFYGPTPAQVKLLDGVLLAAKAATLLETEVRFDPKFQFHFYDLDFCRNATKAGLRLGTWPIAVTHASGGRFGSSEWQAAAALYFEKWPPAMRSPA